MSLFNIDFASIKDLMSSPVIEYLARLSGPPAFLVAIIALVKQIREVKNLHLRNEKLMDDLETAKLSRNKIEMEIRDIEASAIANEIVARRAALNTAEIIKCIDKIGDSAKKIYDDICDVYNIFLEPSTNITREALKKAHRAIKKFLDGRESRHDFTRYYNELETLLKPPDYPHAGGPLYQTIGEKLFETVDSFNGDVFKSRPLILSLEIEKSDYRLTSKQIEEVRSWMDDVRWDFDNLSAILGQVAAQVEIRVGQLPAK